MSLPLPPPTPVQGPPWVAAPRPPLRPGMVTTSWRIVMGVAWTGVLLGVAAVWRSSRTLGLGTWWLGSTSEPQPFVVQLLPSVIPLAVVIAVLRNARLLPAIGSAAAVALAVVGAVDLGRFARFGWIELTLAGAGLVVSLASIAGLQRRPRPTSTDRDSHGARR